MRLDKFLVENRIGSRSQVKEYIKKGMVQVNGQASKKPEEKVDENKDIVTFQGKEINYEKYTYIMLHKPAGVITATEDKSDQTVMDLLPSEYKKDCFPVGRLDKDTEGLLLITNNGELAHQLLSPKKHVDKTYFVRSNGLITNQMIATLQEGVDIGDEKKTLPSKAELLNASVNQSELNLTITEGRFHQVKRMIHVFDQEVIYLKRLSMGNLKLDDSLQKGAYRFLTEDEIQGLIDRK